jgi:hypothetical protein
MESTTLGGPDLGPGLDSKEIMHHSKTVNLVVKFSLSLSIFNAKKWLEQFLRISVIAFRIGA